MTRRAALLLGILALACGAPPAAAQDPGGGSGREGPGALWDAYPLDQRPDPATEERRALPGPSPGGGTVAAWRDEPEGSPGLELVAALCMAAGIALAGTGLALSRRRPRPLPGRPRAPRRTA